MNTKTSLLEAVNEKSAERILYFLKSGIDLKENGFGTDLLKHAAETENNERIIEYLLEYGAKPNHDVLLSVIRRSYDEVIIEKLLKHGAEPTVQNVSWDDSSLPSVGSNALHELALRRKSKLCELLLKYGAEVNKDCYGCHYTPLVWAIEFNDINTMEVLLQYGANPLQFYYGPGCPLQKIFNLPVPIIETFVKYASLQVEHNDDTSVYNFLAHFRGAKSDNPKSREYFQFATKCLGEIEILKQHWLVENKFTMFDFVVSQGDKLNSFRSNANIVNKIFKLLSIKFFPVYSDVIVKKFERITLVSKVLEFSHLKWNVVSQGKKVYIDISSVEYICKLLTDKDLRNLFLAFVSQ